MLNIDDSYKESFFKKPPRTTLLKKYFDELILAKKNIPRNYNFDLEKLFGFNGELLEFAKEYQKYETDFDKHARASIPFSYEESIILYFTILKFLSKKGGNILSIDAASGSLERVVVKLSGGKIKSLFTTVNESNVRVYNKKPVKDCIAVKIASKDILTVLKNDKYLNEKFSEGFDFFLELVSFQMYGDERDQPIKYFKQILKKNGIAIFFEKNSNLSKDEFLERSKIKEKYKLRFFTKKDIEEKEKEVLTVMDKNLVTLEKLKESIFNNYMYLAHIWNSVNFNIIIASDSRKSLNDFIQILPNIIIEDEFLFEKDDLFKIIERDNF